MKTRQHRAQILHFESGTESEWIAFIRKNAPLLQNFILYFDTPLSTQAQKLCASYGLIYAINHTQSQPPFHLTSATSAHRAERATKSSKALDSANTQTSQLESSKAESTTANKTESRATNKIDSSPKPTRPSYTLIKKVRSGEEITLENGIIIGDVAHGAKVFASQNLIIFGDCAGAISVQGDIIVLRNLTSGYIAFNNRILQESIIKQINANNHLKIITKNSDTISIQSLL